MTALWMPSGDSSPLLETRPYPRIHADGVVPMGIVGANVHIICYEYEMPLVGAGPPDRVVTACVIRPLADLMSSTENVQRWLESARRENLRHMT